MGRPKTGRKYKNSNALLLVEDIAHLDAIIEKTRMFGGKRSEIIRYIVSGWIKKHPNGEINQ